MLPIVLLAFTLQAPGDLTEEDVPQILDAVAWHFFRPQAAGRTRRLPSFIADAASSERGLSPILPLPPRGPVFVDGARAARAAREIVPSMPAAVSDSAQSYVSRAREDVVSCSGGGECGIDDGGIFLTIEQISPLPGGPEADRLFVSLLVESNDRRRPGRITEKERTLEVVREDGAWRVSGSVFFEYLGVS